MTKDIALSKIDSCIQNNDITRLQHFLSDNYNAAWMNNDLYLLYELTKLHELEIRNGKDGLFSRYTNINELLTEHKYIRRMVRKAEWDPSFSATCFLDDLENKNVSAYELGFAVNSCCVNKERIWRLMQSAAKD